MTLAAGAFDAVHVLTGIPVYALRERDGLVESEGQEWQVTRVYGEGLTVDVLIVASLAATDPACATWLADLPGRGFVSLDGDAHALAALFAACPRMSPSTISRIAAVNLDTASAERVLVSDEDVDGLLEEHASDVPPSMRGLSFTRAADDGWVLSFLGASLANRPPDNLSRLTVSRWNLRYADGRLQWERRAILSDVLLARYAS